MLEVRGEAAPDARSEETGQLCQTMRQRNATSWDYENGTIRGPEETRRLPRMNQVYSRSGNLIGEICFVPSLNKITSKAYRDAKGPPRSTTQRRNPQKKIR